MGNVQQSREGAVLRFMEVVVKIRESIGRTCTRGKQLAAVSKREAERGNQSHRKEGKQI